MDNFIRFQTASGLMHPLEKIIGSVEPMLETILLSAETEGIRVFDYTVDHVCYRVATIERYQECKDIIWAFGTCIGECMIAGRPIATFLLTKPIQFREFFIECVELPAPKLWKSYEEGWEHAECAVGILPSEFIREYPNVLFGIDEIEKKINPEIERKYGNYVLKFHEHPLKYVVEVLQK